MEEGGRVCGGEGECGGREGVEEGVEREGERVGVSGSSHTVCQPPAPAQPQCSCQLHPLTTPVCTSHMTQGADC